MADWCEWYSVADTVEEIEATREGFSRAYGRSPAGDYSSDDLIEDAKRGLLLIITSHGAQAAICLHVDTQQRVLLVVAAYNFTRSAELVSQVFVMLDEVALLMRCKRVVFDSERLGWRRVAPRFGYSRINKQFYKQVA